jgi:hypothetical protein
MKNITLDEMKLVKTRLELTFKAGNNIFRILISKRDTDKMRKLLCGKDAIETERTELEYLMGKRITKLTDKDPQMLFALQSLSDVLKDDEVWEYDDLGFLSGTAGFLLVRAEKPIRKHVTTVS